MSNKKKAFLEMPFSWLFAIIAGAFILFLAIYLSIKIIHSEQTTIDAKTGKEIGILLNPLETGFESGKTSFLSMPVDTRIYNKCYVGGEFGQQKIRISQKSFNKWTETNIDVGFQNKYILSENYVEGKKFYIFSKPFNFPFKVADLVYITPSEKNYCFLDAPENINEEISDLNQKNLIIQNCSSVDFVRVCFMSGANCNIRVSYGGGYVEKSSGRMYFEDDALMYAAIFSEKEIYECQIRRLMQRVENLALIYNEKAVFISQTSGCDSNLDLLSLSNRANSLATTGSSVMLNSISSLAEDIEEKNSIAVCRLW